MSATLPMHLHKPQRKIAALLRHLGWKHLLAKNASYVETIFGHSLAALEVMTQLILVMEGIPAIRLDAQRRMRLLVAAALHDAGKSNPAFQAYIKGQSSWVSHDRDQDVADVLARAFEELGLFEEEDRATIKGVILLHMSVARRSPTRMLSPLLLGGVQAAGFDFEVKLVAQVDRAISSSSITDAFHALSSPNTATQGLIFDYIQTPITDIEHQFAAEVAHEVLQGAGLTPVLIRTDGRIYARPRTQELPPDTLQMIAEKLAARIEQVLKQAPPEVMIGERASAIVANPDLYTPEGEADLYRHLLFRFRGIDRYKARAHAPKYWKLYWWRHTLGLSAAEARRQFRRSQEKQEVDGDPTRAEIDGEIVDLTQLPKSWIAKGEEHLQAASQAGDLMRYWYTLHKELAKRSADPKAYMAALHEEYQAVFGEGTAEWLKGLGTAPHGNVAFVADDFVRRRGTDFGDDRPTRIISWPRLQRNELLIKLLTGISQAMIRRMGPPRGFSELSRQMADAFMETLHLGSIKPDLAEIKAAAAKTLSAYTTSKPYFFATRKKRAHMCPRCNRASEQTIMANKTMLSRSRARIVRGPEGARQSGVQICNICHYSIMLRKILLGDADHVLMLYPRAAIGPRTAQRMVRAANELTGSLTAMLGESAQGLALANPGRISDLVRKGRSIRPRAIGAALAEQRPDPEQMLIRQLKAYGSLDKLNAICGDSQFGSHAEIASALVSGEGIDPTARTLLLSLVGNVQVRQRALPQTPQMLLLPLHNPFEHSRNPFATEDESLANAELKALFATLLFAVAFDCAAALIPKGAPIERPMARGLVRVPDVQNLKIFFPSGWVQPDEAERWLRGIAAADVLGKRLGLNHRNHIYLVLTAQSAGELLMQVRTREPVGEARKALERLVDDVHEIIRAQDADPAFTQQWLQQLQEVAAQTGPWHGRWRRFTTFIDAFIEGRAIPPGWEACARDLATAAGIRGMSRKRLAERMRYDLYYHWFRRSRK